MESNMGMSSTVKNKMYLAAKYDKRCTILSIAAILMLNGYEVTAKWLDGTHEDTGPDVAAKFATADLDSVEEADTLVLFNLPISDPQQSSGRHVELGYALALNKKVIIVGGGNSIFYELADERYATVEEFLKEYAPGTSWR
jgi:nucleoside 2-deoxyribosyltransferase